LDTEIRERDRLILYGRTPRIAEIDRRQSDGERSHHEAVSEQERISREERATAGR
jgi:hypothetical protein